MKRRTVRREIERKKFVYLFLAPTFVLLLLFEYYPAVSAVYHSFFDWDGFYVNRFIGLANYREILFDDWVLRTSVANMLKLMAFGLGVGLVMPIFVAEVLFSLRSIRWKYIYRVLLVLPALIPGIVGMLLWGYIYEPTYGLANQLLRAVGLGSLAREWLGDPKVALYALMFMGFPWVGGIGVLIYLAGLQNIPQEVLDCCKLDGAHGIIRFFKVDLPLIMGQVKLNVIMGFIGGIQGFGVQLILTKGGPGFATMVPGLVLYDNAFKYGRMGYASAIGVCMFVTIMGLTYANMKYLKSGIEYQAKS
ncbi:MAG: sugar ABC transporter permease [Bacillota bacterium]|nr:sugar ABC transporter permease [Bacillota bacterium]